MRWAANIVAKSMRARNAHPLAFDLLRGLHAIGINGGTKRPRDAPPPRAPTMRVPESDRPLRRRRTEPSDAGEEREEQLNITTLPIELLVRILHDLLSVTHIFHDARIAATIGGDESGGKVGPYERGIVRLVRHQMHLWATLRQISTRINAIVLSREFRNGLYIEWYSINLFTRTPDPVRRARQRSYPIPEYPQHPGTWYARLIHSAILADHLVRTVTVASLITRLRKSDYDKVEDFYFDYVGTQRHWDRQDPPSPPMSVYKQGQQDHHDQTDRALAILNPSDHATKFRANVASMMAALDRSLYRRIHHTLNAFVPGALELVYDNRFRLVTDRPRDQEGPLPTNEYVITDGLRFPGSDWIAENFNQLQEDNTIKPWYQRVAEIPELQYYAMLRGALAMDGGGADVLRVPYMFRESRIPIEAFEEHADLVISGNYHLFYPDLYGDTGRIEPDDEEDAMGIRRLYLAPLPVIPCYGHLQFDVARVRFIDSAVCSRWLGVALRYSMLQPEEDFDEDDDIDERSLDPQARSAVVRLHNVYNNVPHGDSIPEGQANVLSITVSIPLETVHAMEGARAPATYEATADQPMTTSDAAREYFTRRAVWFPITTFRFHVRFPVTES